MKSAIIAPRADHGTRVCYVGGCRCAPCTASNRDRYRERMTRMREQASEVAPTSPGIPSTMRRGGRDVSILRCPGANGAACVVGGGAFGFEGGWSWGGSSPGGRAPKKPRAKKPPRPAPLTAEQRRERDREGMRARRAAMDPTELRERNRLDQQRKRRRDREKKSAEMAMEAGAGWS